MVITNQVGTEFAITLGDFYKEGYGIVNHALDRQMYQTTVGYWVFINDNTGKIVAYKYNSTTREQVLTGLERGWDATYVALVTDHANKNKTCVDTVIYISLTHRKAEELSLLAELTDDCQFADARVMAAINKVR